MKIRPDRLTATGKVDILTNFVTLYLVILPESVMKRSRRATRWPWWAMLTLPVLAVMVWLLLPIFLPFVLAAVLAYVLQPAFLALRRRGVSTSSSALVVMVATVLLALLSLVLIAPVLIGQVQAVLARLPDMVDWFHHRLSPWLLAQFGVALQIDAVSIKAALVNNLDSIRTTLSRLLPVLGNGGAVVATWLSNMVLVPFALFYFLRDGSRLLEQLKALLPRAYATGVIRLGRELDRALGAYLRGQLLVMVIMASIYGLGWWSIGLKSGLAIGVLAGLLVFIPYLGALLGIGMATISAILQFDTGAQVLLVWAVYIVGQMIESYVVTPRLVGERIGLSPLAVVFALMAFGQLFGFVGVIIALPLAAILVVVLRELLGQYYASRFYRRTIRHHQRQKHSSV